MMDELLRLFRKFNFMKGDPDSLVESYALKGILKLFPEEVVGKITEGFDAITKNTEELLTAKSFLKLTEEAGLFPELPYTVWDEENYPVFIIQTDLYCRLIGKRGFALAEHPESTDWILEVPDLEKIAKSYVLSKPEEQAKFLTVAFMNFIDCCRKVPKILEMINYSKDSLDDLVFFVKEAVGLFYDVNLVDSLDVFEICKNAKYVNPMGSFIRIEEPGQANINVRVDSDSIVVFLGSLLTNSTMSLDFRPFTGEREITRELIMQLVYHGLNVYQLLQSGVIFSPDFRVRNELLSRIVVDANGVRMKSKDDSLSFRDLFTKLYFQE